MSQSRTALDVRLHHRQYCRIALSAEMRQARRPVSIRHGQSGHSSSCVPSKGHSRTWVLVSLHSRHLSRMARRAPLGPLARRPEKRRIGPFFDASVSGMGFTPYEGIRAKRTRDVHAFFGLPGRKQAPATRGRGSNGPAEADRTRCCGRGIPALCSRLTIVTAPSPLRTAV